MTVEPEDLEPVDTKAPVDDPEVPPDDPEAAPPREREEGQDNPSDGHEPKPDLDEDPER